ncbi:hypothetical protein B0T18DRAFT_432822 [Schizothecium vesticola]|uniref:Uncharacterized protein n=1 Tax=Schizothecium vesticola TaxID=314040 RepID=A0AA40BPB9_9PEZI|nr:hypothetical protein B0T18DRAFT_432822 [Schizothecium vesticola]
MLLAKEFVPEMARQNHGHVVSLCSMSSVVAPPEIVDYAASRGGIMLFHKVSLFLGGSGVGGFFAPLLHVDTVGERVVGALYSTYGITIYLLGIMRFVASFKRAPE